MEPRERTMLFIAGGSPAGTGPADAAACSTFVDAGSGSEGDAVQLALDMQPDVVVVDMDSPDVDAPAIAAALQADGRTCRIPIVAVTSRWTPAVQQEARRVGISAVLLTPCSDAQFAAEVDRVVRQSRLLSSALGTGTGAHPAPPMGLGNAVRRRQAY